MAFVCTILSSYKSLNFIIWELKNNVINQSQKWLLFPVSRWKVFKVVCRRGHNTRPRAEAHAGLGFHWVSTQRIRGLCTNWYVNICVHLFMSSWSFYSFYENAKFSSLLSHHFFWFDLSEAPLQTSSDSSLSDQQPPAKRKYVLKNKAHTVVNTYNRGRFFFFFPSSIYSYIDFDDAIICCFYH